MNDTLPLSWKWVNQDICYVVSMCSLELLHRDWLCKTVYELFYIKPSFGFNSTINSRAANQQGCCRSHSFSHVLSFFFPLQSCSWEWHRKQRGKTLVSELVRYNWLFAVTAQTIMRPRSNWFQWSKCHVPLLKQPLVLLCCLTDTFKILQTKCKCTEFSKMHKKKANPVICKVLSTRLGQFDSTRVISEVHPNL